MAVSATISRVQEALEKLGTDCPLEEVTGLCPDLTWNQVFVAIDYLSRIGLVHVTLDPGRTYKVRACKQQNRREPYVPPLAVGQVDR
ncbi:hypothetical protein [Petrachloros mirabilis]